MSRSTKWRRDNPQKQRIAQIRRTLRKRYGLTAEQWNKMLIEQAGRCAICTKPMTGKRDPAVDHCHKSGTVRKLLCNHCNRMLGGAMDSANTLLAAILYLESFSQ
jgi:hypothetical protein